MIAVHKNKEHSFYAILLFLIWPFLSLILAIKEYKSNWAKNVVWVFTAFFAYSKVAPFGIYTDAVGYRMKFVAMTRTGTFESVFTGLFTEKADAFEPLLSFIVSRFTEDYKIYFMIIGLFYGYFFSRNIWFFFERKISKFRYVDIIILLTLSLIIPMWNLGGFRFWLASHIFIYGVLNYIYKKDTKYILLILSAFLVHFSFAIPIGVFLIYRFFGNRTNFYFIFFIVSIFLTGLSGETLRTQSDILPDVYKNRVDGYTNEEYIDKIKTSQSATNWYVSFSRYVLKYVSYLFLIIIFLKGKYQLLTREQRSLFSFVLLFYGIANFLSPFSSASRFLTPAGLFTFTFIFLYLQDMIISRILDKYILIVSPFLLVFIIVAFRKGFDWFGLSTIFGNPLIVFFLEEQLPLIDYIKSLIM